MHERPVTENILKIVLDYVEENEAEKVKNVQLVIGRLTGVVEDSVRFYWESLTVDTPAEGAELKVENVPIKVKCHNCGEEYEAEDQFSLFCPSCDFFGGEVISGKELLVDKIEVE